MEAEKPIKKKMSRVVIGIILAFTLGPVVMALILRMFVIEAFKVPSGAMIPSVQPGDRLFVSKWSKVVARGDVIVFKFPENPAQDFIKRAVALGGDTLEVLDGRLVINDELAPQCYVGPFQSEGRPSELYLEKLNGHVYGVLHAHRVDEKKCASPDDCTAACGNGDCTRSCRHGICVAEVDGPYHIKDGELWVVGDNRDNTFDSRKWNHGVGRGVPFDFVKGKALSVFLGVEGRGGADVQGVPRLTGPNTGLKPALDQCEISLHTH